MEIGLILCQRFSAMRQWLFDYCLAIDSIDINAAQNSSLIENLVRLQCIDVDDRGKRQLLAVESIFPVMSITEWVKIELPSYSYTYWQVVLMLFRLGCFGSSILDFPEKITFADFEIELLEAIDERLVEING